MELTYGNRDQFSILFQKQSQNNRRKLFYYNSYYRERFECENRILRTVWFATKKAEKWEQMGHENRKGRTV